MQLVTQKVPGRNLRFGLFFSHLEVYLQTKRIGIFSPIQDLVGEFIQWLLYFNIYAVLHTLYSRKKIDKTFSPPPHLSEIFNTQLLHFLSPFLCLSKVKVPFFYRTKKKSTKKPESMGNEESKENGHKRITNFYFRWWPKSNFPMKKVIPKITSHYEKAIVSKRSNFIF